MARTMTVDTAEELRGFVESLGASGNYKTSSEVVRDRLRLLQEKQATSKLATLQKLIDEGENSKYTSLCIISTISLITSVSYRY
jgi:antitoxin ParD1/3/4